MNRTDNTDTIFALATADAPAAISLFRGSGPSAADLYQALTGTRPDLPRKAARVSVVDPEADGVLIDDGLGIWFPGPSSYTGEDSFELTLHGSRAVAAAVMRVALDTGLCRLAEPGEFTRRAVLAGKIDLTQAEAIGDLVTAETEAQRVLARRHKDGAIGKMVGGWQERITGLLAHLEAVIDFPDEDLPDEVSAEVDAGIAALATELESHRDGRERFERLRSGFSIAIVGAPNAGKSTLLNQLAKRDAAIVSSRAGTTRDVVEVHLEIGGFPVSVSDTAGLHQSDDEIEIEGMRRARLTAEAADFVIAVFDAESDPILDSETGIFLGRESTTGVLNKVDLGPAAVPEDLLPVSALSGEGIGDLVDRLEREIATGWGQGEPPMITRERHWSCVRDAGRALSAARENKPAELRAEDLRMACRHLARITGVVGMDDVLDRIFRDFCIGK